ncbi:MAG: hypothetical protein WBD40_11790, partial [Tepidisphaeraceae bacterium]
MQAPVKQLAILAAALATLAGGVVGCDDSLASDKQVRRAVVESREVAATGEGGREEALKKLQDAAGNTGAGPAASAQAKSILAAAEKAEAARLMQTVDANNRDIARLVYEIGILGNQIANSNLKIAGYRGTEPKAAREDAAKKISEVQGSGDKTTWITADNANIPTLDAVKQDVSRLQGEIAKQQEEIKNLDAQRVAAGAESDKNREASEKEKGQKSVDLFKVAADAQKKAADLATQIDVAQAKIVPLQRDLAVAEAQQSAAAKAIETYKKQVEALDAGWKGTELQIQTQAQIATGLLGAANATPPAEGAAAAAANSINEKAALLAQKILETQGIFAEADQRLDNSIKNYDNAVKSADQLAGEARTKREGVERNSPYYKAWDDLLLIVNPAVYKLGQAEANQMRATLHTSQAISLLGQQRLMQQLQPILEGAKLEMPAALTGQSIDTELQRTTELANTTYDEAAKLYEEVASAPQDISAKGSARVGRIFSIYGKVLLARAGGNAQQAAELLELARGVRDTATQEKTPLPPMPV